MAINITFSDDISGNEAPLTNIDENMALETLFNKLEENGFGPFSKLDSQGALVVEPANGDPITHPWNPDFLKYPLVKLDVSDGCTLKVAKQNKVA